MITRLAHTVYIRLDRGKDGWFIVKLVQVRDNDTKDLIFSGSFGDYLAEHWGDAFQQVHAKIIYVPSKGKIGRRI